MDDSVWILNQTQDMRTMRNFFILQMFPGSLPLLQGLGEAEGPWCWHSELKAAGQAEWRTDTHKLILIPHQTVTAPVPQQINATNSTGTGCAWQESEGAQQGDAKIYTLRIAKIAEQGFCVTQTKAVVNSEADTAGLCYRAHETFVLKNYRCTLQKTSDLTTVKGLEPRMSTQSTDKIRSNQFQDKSV